MKHFYVLTTTILFLFIHAFALAENCNCDHVITPAKPYVDGKTMNIKPGDVICIKAGDYKFLNLFNFSGTASNPIKFVNCGGQVVIGGNRHYYGLLLNNVNYFRFTGTGISGIRYGFKISGINGSGSGVAGYGTHGEIDHLEIARTGFAGILYKNDPSCDPSSWKQNFVMRQISVHDNYIHDTGGEGIYIGYTGGPKKLTCNGKSVTAYPHNIEGLRVYNNIIENTGWDGLQVSRATKDCEIYNNTIRNFGTRREKYQDEGILIGGGTTGKLYNNRVIKGTGVGIQVFGTGNNYIFNNIIADVEVDGIFCDDRETVAGRGFYFINNTIVNPGSAGMRMYSTQSKGNVFYNNIVAGASKDVVLLNAPIDWKASNNIFVKSAREAGFTDPSRHDYSLKSGSPAIDKGKDVGAYGVSKDIAGTKRPSGSAYDIGAYEYGAAVTSGNQSPTVDAGEDVSLTLPSRQTTLTAKAQDSDGKISKYAWKQMSGPSAASLSGKTAASLKVSNLKAGRYTFQVTVTDNRQATAQDQVQVQVLEKQSNSKAGNSSRQGLSYAYYEGTWTRLPSFSSLSPKKTGISKDFSMRERQKNDFFAFAYQGYIEISKSGRYTFYTTSDDGSALYINGQKVVDNDGLHGRREQSGSITLSEGRHAIRIVFFEKSGRELLNVRYAGPGFEKRSIPLTALFTGNSSTNTPVTEHQENESKEERTTFKQGLRYSYYRGKWDRLPDFRKMKAEKTGTVSNFSLSPRTVNTYYGFAFEGYVEISRSGKYTFHTTSDDGSVLYINGRKVVDNDGLHAKRERSGSIYLGKGLHAIQVRYFDKWGNHDMLQVQYSGPGISKRAIPDQVLFQASDRARISDSKKEHNATVAEDLQAPELKPFAVSAYPNPVEEVIYLAVEGYHTLPQDIAVSVTDLRGKTVILTDDLQYEGNRLSVNMAVLPLPAGIYFLHVTVPDGNIAKIKFIKK